MAKKAKSTFTSNGFTVSKVVSHGEIKYSVDLGKHPSKEGRNRKLASTAAEARRIASIWRRRLDNEGKVAFNLTEDQRLDAAKALKLLGDTCSLEKAAKHYITQVQPASTPGLTFEKLCEDFLKWMESAKTTMSGRTGGYRPASISDIRSQLALPRAHFGDKDPGQLTDSKWQTYLDHLDAKPRQKKNIRTSLQTLYKWATRDKGPLSGKTNPILAVKKIYVAEKTPVIWPITDVARWLDATVTAEAEGKIAKGSTAGQALLFFSGIRPAELLRLNLESIGELEIILSADSTKTNKGRIIPMEDNLRAWLAHYPYQPRSEANLKRLRVIVREYSGLSYYQDVARHCYITAVACTHGMGTAALYAGNTEKVIRRHYLGLTTSRKKWAEEYFAIMPS